MKILYIRTSNIYDDSRATKEICALAEKGYKIHVIGWNRDGKARECSEKVFSKYNGVVTVDFFDAHLGGGIGLKNINKLFRWVWWTYKQIKRNSDVDVIHACNLDAALGILKYAKRKGIKIVYDIYDYYIDSHSIPGIVEKMIERLEIKIINSSETTIICTEERKEQIAKANPKKIIVIHNSPNVEKINNVEKKYDYAYCGALFGKRLIKEIFDCYPKNENLSFAIAGYGDYSELAKELNGSFEKFNYFGSISYEQVLSIENEARVISAIYEPTIRNHRLCAPNKFYEALALAKPVIVCRGTGIDKIIDDNKAGIVIDYDAEQFYEAVNYLINNPTKCEEMGTNARRLYENEYKWEIMEQRLINVYADIKI